MGAPAENLTYQEIVVRFGEITDFSGSGTDDSALKHILCDAIERTQGYPTADAWAEAWMNQEEQFHKGMFWIPVMNSFWRIRAEGIAPREAGLGNMASSSSAMCISPMGIINAGNPRQAALETYEVAGLIHHNFSRDAACSMAAAVAEAFNPDASVDSVLTASVDYLPPRSSQVMRGFIQKHAGAGPRNRRLCRSSASATMPNGFCPGSRCPTRARPFRWPCPCFTWRKGIPKQTILYGANFGRDADTIASMAGALAGALHGASALPVEWVEKIRRGWAARPGCAGCHAGRCHSTACRGHGTGRCDPSATQREARKKNERADHFADLDRQVLE